MVTIWKHAIVGSSAVVTKSVPAFSVVAGIPVRAIRRYDKKTKTWIRSGNLETVDEF